MIVFTFCVLILASNCLGKTVSDDELLRQYIKDIQSQTDDTIKPCEHFGKYACGKLTHKETVELDIETELAGNEKSDSEDSKLIKTLYLSCKNGADITKFLEQVDVLKSISDWPVTRDYSDQEIATLFGYLATIDVVGLLSMEFEYLTQENIISIQLESNLHIDEEVLATTLQKFGSTSEGSHEIVESITNLIQQFRNIKSDENDEEFNKFTNVAAWKEAVPNFDWDAYFIAFAKEFHFEIQTFVKNPVQTKDLKKLNKIISIIKETDSKTVMNYIIARFISAGLNIDCEKLIPFAFPILAIDNITKDADYENFFLKEIDAFKHFELSLSELKSQLNDPQSKDLQKFAKFEKNLYEDYKSFLNGKYLTNLLSGYEFSEKTLYTNLLNIVHVAFKDILAHGKQGHFLAFVDFLRFPVRKYLSQKQQPKPMLYNFITNNNLFWNLAIDIDRTYENRTISDACFPYENKTGNYQNKHYLNTHAAYHTALNDYIHFIAGNRAQFKKHTRFLTEVGLNHEKAYMLALAQEKCANSETQSLTDDDELLWFFKHSKEFSYTWGCEAGDAMNKVCNDSTFIADFKKMPHVT